MFTIEYAANVDEQLAELRAFDRKRILDRIEGELIYEPTTQTRNKKIIVGFTPPWEYAEPIWELRIGQYRAFYDVNVDELIVRVRAIRRKPPHRTTEEIV